MADTGSNRPLRELGYEQDAHYLVIYFDQPSEILQRLFDSDALGCYIHAYPDTREDRGYSASMKPWLLAQCFQPVPRTGVQGEQLP